MRCKKSTTFSFNAIAKKFFQIYSIASVNVQNSKH